MRVASTVVTVSENTRSDLEAEFPRGGPPVEVIHWGCDLVPPGSARPLVGEYVLALGGGAPRKNVLGTLRAFSIIAERHPDLKLVVLGMGRADLSHELLAQAETMGLAGRLVVPGFVSDSELPAWFEHAACLCYLSLYEGFGLPLLEAMSFGVPVVASSTSSIPEVVGDAGLLVDPLDAEAAGAAIDRILRDREFRRQLRDVARKRAGDFPWNVAADRMAKTLITAAKRHRSLS
jgi:glycosyltransferase involved in cell wall biosynthesis